MDFKTQLAGSTGLAGITADALLVLVTSSGATPNAPVPGLDKPLADVLAAALKDGDFAYKAGQTLYVQNGDQTAHNYRFQTNVNPIYNKVLAPGEGFEITYTRPEPPFVVTCRQHPWERGYVAVMSHPFFAVTGRNGYFAIEGLPPGDYEVVVWHEKFAGARAKVSVGEREVKVASFAFKYPADVR